MLALLFLEWFEIRQFWIHKNGEKDCHMPGPVLNAGCILSLKEKVKRPLWFLWNRLKFRNVLKGCSFTIAPWWRLMAEAAVTVSFLGFWVWIFRMFFDMFGFGSTTTLAGMLWSHRTSTTQFLRSEFQVIWYGALSNVLGACSIWSVFPFSFFSSDHFVLLGEQPRAWPLEDLGSQANHQHSMKAHLASSLVSETLLQIWCYLIILLFMLCMVCKMFRRSVAIEGGTGMSWTSFAQRWWIDICEILTFCKGLSSKVSLKNKLWP